MNNYCSDKLKRKVFQRRAAFVALWMVLMGGCGPASIDEPTPSEGFVEREAVEVVFTNIEVAYVGDDMGEGISDGWLLKFYTDMQITPSGNPIGPGCVAQILVNAPYDKNQGADVSLLRGIYASQTSSGDFSVGTFVSGYSNIVELPGQRVEIVDATFWADLTEGQTTMDYDLVDDGAVEISGGGDHFAIEGVLVGQKCRKHRFRWSGSIEPKSYVEPELPNSTLSEDVRLEGLEQLYIQDRGDIYYLRDESCRCFTVFLATEGVEFSSGRPEASGDFVRLDLLVPWQSSVEEGIPEGSYTMTTRNEDTSIDRDKLLPFTLIPGLPNRFTYPYWSGSWYVNLSAGEWGEKYARIDDGSVVVERGEDGSHHIVCRLSDSSKEPYTITAEVRVGAFGVLK